MKASKLAARQNGAKRWQPLVPARPIPLTSEQREAQVAHALAVFAHIPRETIIAQIDELMKEEFWKNDRYQVAKRRFAGDPPIIHLSIKTLDKQPVRDWRDCQHIKNQLVGSECEGVELYPAESRLVDTANSYHIWVVEDPTFRFPFGWNVGRHVDGRSVGGAVQRPLDSAQGYEP
jgi:hypothetical protein